MPWYDRQGKPITLAEAVTLVDDNHVASTRMGPYHVSTIWIGVSFEPVPEIFETMVFVYGKSIARARYTTEEDALAGHKKIVEEFRAKVQ